MRLALLSLPLLATWGCKGDLDGIWLFTVDVTEDADDCEVVVSHNFLDAWVPDESEDETAWTSETTATGSQWVFFGLWTTTGPDTATLVVEGDSYPGLLEADGSWNFAWTWFNGTTSSDSHEDGYVYQTTYDYYETIDFSLSEAEQGLQGETGQETFLNQRWSETDFWSTDIQPNSRLPAGTYLVTYGDMFDEFGDPVEEPARNDPDGEECETERCTITRQSACEVVWSLTALKTALEEGEAFDALDGAGQTSGL